MAGDAKTSPFAPQPLPCMPRIDGVRFATAEAGIRYKGRTDLMVAVLRRRHRSSRRPHPVKDLLRRRLVVPRKPAGRRRATSSLSTRATPTPSPANAAAMPWPPLPNSPPTPWRQTQSKSTSPRPASLANRWMRRNSPTCSQASPNQQKQTPPKPPPAPS